MNVSPISSRKNAQLLHIRKLLQSASYQKECGEFVGDGLKLLETGWNADFPFHTLVFTEKTLPQDSDLPDVPIILVPEDVMTWLSPMKTPQGALFVGKIPTPPPLDLSGQFLILDGVQDAGNVGTIWRSCHGLGADGLILLENCASPWRHKTVRSSMGACFHLPVYEMTGAEMLALFDKEKRPLYGTALNPESKSLRDCDLSTGSVVIGSEGQGIRPEILGQCTAQIYLPMTEGCQSLNAGIAAGIVLWEMGKGS